MFISPRHRPHVLVLLVCATLAGAPTSATGPGGANAHWLRIFSTATLSEAKRVQRLIASPSPGGGRVRQVFLRRGTGPEGTTHYEVLAGPFEHSLDAVLHGLRLRGDVRFAREGVRLDGLAVLLPTSFVTLPLRFGGAEVERLNPGGKRPYPSLGDLLVARAMAFVRPTWALPPMEQVTARFDPFSPLLLVGEREVCAPKGPPCLRWFEVLHPTLIQTVWIPANLVVPRRDLRPMELGEGAGRTRARGALYAIGTSGAGTQYALVFRRGSLPPQRFVVTLADRLGPPFRLVADRHGPGIYNREGKVVLRPTLGAWTYHRPPLWQIPAHAKDAERQAPGPRARPGRPARPGSAIARPAAGPMGARPTSLDQGGATTPRPMSPGQDGSMSPGAPNPTGP